MSTATARIQRAEQNDAFDASPESAIVNFHAQRQRLNVADSTAAIAVAVAVAVHPKTTNSSAISRDTRNDCIRNLQATKCEQFALARLELEFDEGACSVESNARHAARKLSPAALI